MRDAAPVFLCVACFSRGTGYVRTYFIRQFLLKTQGASSKSHKQFLLKTQAKHDVLSKTLVFK
jgi:hypothetical protein